MLCLRLFLPPNSFFKKMTNTIIMRMHFLADGSSIPNRRIRFMQKPCRFEPIQLAFVFSFLLFSCAAPNYRVDISFDKGISYFRALKNVDDISLYYSNFEEEGLERSSCYFSNGVFRAEHHKTYILIQEILPQSLLNTKEAQKKSSLRNAFPWISQSPFLAITTFIHTCKRWRKMPLLFMAATIFQKRISISI